MTEPQHPCDICGHRFNHDEISLAEDNEFDLDLCDSCLKGQRELDVQEEVDFDFLRDVRQELMQIQRIRDLQELHRRIS